MADRLSITCDIFRALVDHAREPGSFRYLIYDRLGFGTDDYAPLYEAGGMAVANMLGQAGPIAGLAAMVDRSRQDFDAMRPVVLALARIIAAHDAGDASEAIEDGRQALAAFNEGQEHDGA